MFLLSVFGELHGRCRLLYENLPFCVTRQFTPSATTRLGTDWYKRRNSKEEENRAEDMSAI